MAFYSTAVFVGAFLLFFVQPVLGRFLLPVFGGGAAVWTACLVFFQGGLFLGYLYAHFLGRIPLRAQVLFHAGFGVAAILLGGDLRSFLDGFDAAPGDLFWGIQRALVVSVGLPYVLLAATSPTLQRWLERARPGAPAYRLYSISNLASFAALLLYPTLIERVFTRTEQASIFRGGYVLFVLVVAVAGFDAVRATSTGARVEVEAVERRGSPGRVLVWWLYPALSSAWLVAVTQAVSQNVPPMPFLWLFFLAAYLASYAFAFRGWNWVCGSVMTLAFALQAVALGFAHYDRLALWDEHFGLQVGLYGGTLFCGACFLHGRVYRARPARAGSSSFYLALAGGGAIGGLLVAVVVPAISSGWIELPVLILATSLLALLSTVRASGRARRPLTALLALLWVAFAGYLGYQEVQLRDQALLCRRNSFGVHTVYELQPEDPVFHRYQLHSGSIVHGWQFQRPEYRAESTAYFTRQSGVGRALRAFPDDRPLNIGVVGLGAGVLATYGAKGDRMRFYEIDPKVIDLAEQTFTFLSDSAADVEIVEGDARIVLQNEPDQNFDLLVLDAFSGDAIPVHLLTSECFEIYLRHLQAEGVIAAHVSSRYLDLVRVLATTAAEHQLEGVWISNHAEDLAALPSTWVLLCRNRRFFSHPGIAPVARSLRNVRRPSRLWTDEHAALFEVLSWGRR